MKFLALAVLSMAAFCFAGAQEAAKPAASSVARKDLLKAELDPEKSVSALDVKEVSMGPKQKAPLHLHPCPVAGVVLEGSISFQIEGKSVQTLKAGDAFYEPANTRIAKFDNDGEVPARFAVFYLLGKDDRDTVKILSK